MTKKIFISYSEKDLLHRQNIEKQLKAWVRSQKIAIWHREMLNVAEEIAPRIAEELANAEIMMVLLSADYLADDTLYQQELAPILQKENKILVPIMVRPCVWQDTLPQDVVVLPSLEKAISQYDEDEDAAWLQVVNALREVVENGANAVSLPKEPEKREITMTKTVHIPVDDQGNFHFSQTIINTPPQILEQEDSAHS